MGDKTTPLKKSSTGSTEMTPALLTSMNSSSVLDGSVATTNMSQLKKIPWPSTNSGSPATPMPMVSSPLTRSMPMKPHMDSSEMFEINSKKVRNYVKELIIVLIKSSYTKI